MKDAYLINGGASKANKRVESDFYPTPPEGTHALMTFLNLPISVVWEPACGNGSMAQVIKSYGHHVKSTDLRVTGFGEGNVDFLKTKFSCDAIITNPPFNVSAAFIEHAMPQAPIVAMLLKSQYWHAVKRTKLFSSHPPAFVLALNWRLDFNFLESDKGHSPLMDMIWTVWISGSRDTRYKILQKPPCKVTQQGIVFA